MSRLTWWCVIINPWASKVTLGKSHWLIVCFDCCVLCASSEITPTKNFSPQSQTVWEPLDLRCWRFTNVLASPQVVFRSPARFGLLLKWWACERPCSWMLTWKGEQKNCQYAPLFFFVTFIINCWTFWQQCGTRQLETVKVDGFNLASFLCR